MKNLIHKSISLADAKIVYSYFIRNKESTRRNAITSKEIAKALNNEYSPTDIRNIIEYINDSKKFKYFILGYFEGYILIDETNITYALEIFEKIERKCTNEFINAQEHKKKVLRIVSK